MQGLRLHDNPALLEAAESEYLCPVFCIDPWFTKPEEIGVNRINFLLESLVDLDNSLKGRKTELLVILPLPCTVCGSCFSRAFCINLFVQVLKGRPEDVFPNVWKAWNITRICFESDMEPYAKERDAKITQLAEVAGELAPPSGDGISC